jgi:hypothetical protein
MVRIIYKLFKSQFNAIIAEEQKLSFKDVDMSYSFTDLNGTMYYTYAHAKYMHVSRYHKLNEYMRMLGSQVTTEELDRMVSAAISSLEYVDPKTGNMQPKISVVAIILKEIENRRERIVSYELIYNLIALLNLNQNEINKGGAFDQSTHDTKISQFLKDNETEPLSGFFLRSGLSIYLPFIAKLQSELKEYTENTLNIIVNQSKTDIENFQALINREIENRGLSVGSETLKNTENT